MDKHMHGPMPQEFFSRFDDLNFELVFDGQKKAARNKPGGL
jgi:hypothetical protein